MDNNLVIDSIKLLSGKIRRTLKDSKYRAGKKNIDFDLDFDYLRKLVLEQKALCFYTGSSFNLNDKLENMSLDRINSDKGYIKGNVVWCLAGINFLKFTRTYGETIKVCKQLVFHRPNWNILKKV
jgi:hypothetical protein